MPARNSTRWKLRALWRASISGYSREHFQSMSFSQSPPHGFVLAFISKLRYRQAVPWRVEILNETVAAEIAALPADMQARFLRLAERIVSAGLESLGEPHVKHLEGKLWELRLTGRDGIARALYVMAIGRRSSWFAHS